MNRSEISSLRVFFSILVSVLMMTVLPASTVDASEAYPEVSILVPDGPQPAGFEIPVILSLDRPWNADLEVSLEAGLDSTGVHRIQPSVVLPAGERKKLVMISRTQPGTLSIKARLPSTVGGDAAEAQLIIESDPSAVLTQWGYGPAFSAAIGGDLAVMGSGAVLGSYDLSHGGFQPLGDVLLPGEVLDIKLSGSRAIALAAGSLLCSIDISDPAHPVLLSSVHVDWSPDEGSWAVDGPLALGIQRRGHLSIFDTTTGRWVSDLDLGLHLKGVAAGEGLAAVATSENTILFVDLSVPASPEVVSTFILEKSTRHLIMDGSLLYAEGGWPGSRTTIVDLNDPLHPAMIASFDSPVASLVGADGGFLLYSVVNEITTVDISHPEAPVFFSSYVSPGLQKLAVSWPRVLTAGGRNGMNLLDFSNPDNPVLSGRRRTPGYLMDVTVLGDTAWAIDESGNLFGIDLRSGRPTTSAYARLGGVPRCIQKLGDTHVVVASQTGRIQVLDVADPAAVRIVGKVEFVPGRSGPTGPFDLVVIGNTGYASTHDGVHVIDLSIPSSPTEIGLLDIGAGSSLASADPDTLIVSGGNMTVVDVSDPTHPQAGITMDSPNSTGDVAADAELVVFSQGRNRSRNRSTRIVNISNPGNPAGISLINAPGRAPALFDDTLMIGGAAWARFLDISEAAAPLPAGMAWIGSGAGDIGAHRRFNIGGGSAPYHNTIVYAAGSMGLAVLADPLSSSPHSVFFESDHLSAVVGQPLTLRIGIVPACDEAVSLKFSSTPADIFASLPTLNIPGGARSVDVSLLPVSAAAPVLLEARVPGLQPAFAAADIVVSRLSLSPAQLQIVEEEQTTLELKLTPPLDHAAGISLYSSDDAVASVSSEIQVPAGAPSIPIVVHAGTAGGPVTVSAQLPAPLGGAAATSRLTVLEAVLPLRLQAAMGDLPVGSARLLRLRLDRPRPDDVRLLLDSDRPELAIVRPRQIVLPAGEVQAVASILALAPGGPVFVRATSPDGLALPVESIEVNLVPASRAPDMAAGILIPFVADRPGAGSAQWTSDLWLYQDAGDNSIVRLYPGSSFQPAEPSNYLEVSVPRGEVVALGNILRATAGYWLDELPYPSLATLLIDVEGIPGSRLRVRSRTHAAAADGYGSRGLGVEGLMIDDLPTAGTEIVVPLPDGITTYRVNLSCANPGETEAAGAVTVYDRDRNILKTLDLDIPSGEMTQWSDISAGIRESAAIASFSWSGPPLACSASWIDTRSGDPTYAPARPLVEASGELVVPALGRLEGIGVCWQSAVAVITDEPVSSIPVRIAAFTDGFLDMDSSMALWENDIVADVFSLDEASGELVVDGQSEALELWTRIYADHGDDGGFGHRVPCLRTDLKAGDSVDFIGLDQNFQFRTNIGAVASGRQSGEAVVELFDAVGKKLGEVELTPWRHHAAQINSVFRTVTERAISGGRAHIRIESGSMYVYASVVDIITGDAVTVVP